MMGRGTDGDGVRGEGKRAERKKKGLRRNVKARSDISAEIHGSRASAQT